MPESSTVLPDARPRAALSWRNISAGHRHDRLRRARRRETITAYALLSPSLLFFLIFLILPTIFAVFLSLSKWSGFDISGIRFIGVANYLEILSPRNQFLAPVLVQTFVFSAIAVVLTVGGSLLIAQLIERIKGQGFWRFLYFLPVVATIVATGNIWVMLYQPGGLINAILNAFGIKSVPFLSDPGTALPSIAVVQAWASIGISLLILTAGIKAIDRTMYEAASIDGAGVWRTFRSITLPLLKPSLLFVFITQSIAALQSFAIIIVMTGDGGPANSTNVAAFDMYQQAFKFGVWGTASAMAMVLFVVIFIITLLQLWISNQGGEQS